MQVETAEFWPEILRLKDTVPLREIGWRFDVVPGAIVAALKRTQGLPVAPAGKRPRRGKVEDLPPEPGEEPAPAKVWQVTIREGDVESSRVVLAASLMEAATLATSARGRAVALRLVGDLTR
jgi:hypothetical protein